jgi:hypothetical protein
MEQPTVVLPALSLLSGERRWEAPGAWSVRSVLLLLLQLQPPADFSLLSLVLPSFSDTKSLKQTLKLEGIAQGLSGTGHYSCMHGPGGQLRSTRVRRDLASSAVNYDLANLFSQKAEVVGKAARTPSSLVFTKSKVRPATAEITTLNAAPGALSCPSSPLGKEVKLQHKGSIPSANLNALEQTSYAPSPRPRTAGAALPPAPATPSQPATEALSSSGASSGATALPIEGNRPGSQGSRPGSQAGRRLGTPQVHDMRLLSPGAARVETTRQFRRTHVPHPMATFRPTRSHAFLVFNDLDTNSSGRLILSDVESCCLGLGFSLEQSHALFRKLDRGRKGFLTMAEWGCPENHAVVQSFTLMYMRQFLGLPDTSASYEEVKRYMRAEEIKTVQSLPAAIKMVKSRAVTKGASRGGDVIYGEGGSWEDRAAVQVRLWERKWGK